MLDILPFIQFGHWLVFWVYIIASCNQKALTEILPARRERRRLVFYRHARGSMIHRCCSVASESTYLVIGMTIS